MPVVNARDPEIPQNPSKENNMKEVTIKEVRLRIVQGDLTDCRTDAIVNAANSRLQHGGGVAGAIVRKGGRVIQDESNRIGFVPVGKAAMTGAGALPARYVIHAVGPMWGEGDEAFKLRSAVRSVLELATKHGLASIAMPAISAGIFGFPKPECAHIIVDEITSFITSEKTSLKEIIICLMDMEIIAFFENELEKVGSGV